jgi:hypothetical protein
MNDDLIKVLTGRDLPFVITLLTKQRFSPFAASRDGQKASISAALVEVCADKVPA